MKFFVKVVFSVTFMLFIANISFGQTSGLCTGKKEQAEAGKQTLKTMGFDASKMDNVKTDGVRASVCARNDVQIHYGFSNPNGITFKYNGTTYNFKSGQTVTFPVSSSSGQIQIWECPAGCQWSSFTIYPGHNYVITNQGASGLTLQNW